MSTPAVDSKSKSRKPNKVPDLNLTQSAAEESKNKKSKKPSTKESMSRKAEAESISPRKETTKAERNPIAKSTQPNARRRERDGRNDAVLEGAPPVRPGYSSMQNFKREDISEVQQQIAQEKAHTTEELGGRRTRALPQPPAHGGAHLLAQPRESMPDPLTPLSLQTSGNALVPPSASAKPPAYAPPPPPPPPGKVRRGGSMPVLMLRSATDTDASEKTSAKPNRFLSPIKPASAPGEKSKDVSSTSTSQSSEPSPRWEEPKSPRSPRATGVGQMRIPTEKLPRTSRSTDRQNSHPQAASVLPSVSQGPARTSKEPQTNPKLDMEELELMLDAELSTSSDDVGRSRSQASRLTSQAAKDLIQSHSSELHKYGVFHVMMVLIANLSKESLPMDEAAITSALKKMEQDLAIPPQIFTKFIEAALTLAENENAFGKDTDSKALQVLVVSTGRCLAKKIAVEHQRLHEEHMTIAQTHLKTAHTHLESSREFADLVKKLS